MLAFLETSPNQVLLSATANWPLETYHPTPAVLTHPSTTKTCTSHLDKLLHKYPIMPKFQTTTLNAAHAKHKTNRLLNKLKNADTSKSLDPSISLKTSATNHRDNPKKHQEARVKKSHQAKPSMEVALEHPLKNV